MRTTRVTVKPYLFAPGSLVSLFACILAISANAASAGFLQDTGHAFLSEEDGALQVEAAMKVLEDTDPRTSRQWRNPKSGSSGRAQGLGNLRSDDGLHCRQLRLWTQAKGVESQFAFPVCKGSDGEWFIASGKKLSKVR